MKCRLTYYAHMYHGCMGTHKHMHTLHTQLQTHTHVCTYTHTHYGLVTYYRSSTGGATAPNINQARPSNTTEEDIQLQLALQMSKEHQEEQDRLRWALSRNEK